MNCKISVLYQSWSLIRDYRPLPISCTAWSYAVMVIIKFLARTLKQRSSVSSGQAFQTPSQTTAFQSTTLYMYRIFWRIISLRNQGKLIFIRNIRLFQNPTQRDCIMRHYKYFKHILACIWLFSNSINLGFKYCKIIL